MMTTNNKTSPLVAANPNVLARERERERSLNLVVVGRNVRMAISKSFFFRMKIEYILRC